MSEENKINQPVEDVFSNVDSVDNNPTPSVTPEVAVPETVEEGMNISEASIGQENVVSPEQKIGDAPEVDEGSQSVSTNKIFFYLVLALIILLGAFAIWALVF